MFKTRLAPGKKHFNSIPRAEGLEGERMKEELDGKGGLRYRPEIGGCCEG